MSYTSLTYHIVFATHGRRRWLSEPAADKLGGYVHGIVANLNGQLIAFGGADNHIHIAARLPPTSPVSEQVGKIKANSSRWLRRSVEGLELFRWQDGYAAFSVSPSMVRRVETYIERQREHHRKTTFDEELAALLEAHGIPHDDRPALA
jgi:REP element-mobilizing transposase RayT